MSWAGFNAVSQQDGKLNDVAKGATDATQKAAQNITPDLSELPDPTNLPNPFDDTGFADKVLLQAPLTVRCSIEQLARLVALRRYQ